MPNSLSNADPENLDDAPPSPAEVPDAHARWQTWRALPTPQHLADTLRAVRPVLDRAVARQPGLSPAIAGAEAKRLAIGAIKTYDPAQGTSLSTHLHNHLRPLGRGLANVGRGVSRSRLDRERAAAYLGAHSALRETHGREPSDAELMDHLQVGGKELAKMRLAGRGEVAEGQAEHLGDARDHQEDTGRLSMWSDFVYHDLPERDRLIMDLSMGRHGHETHDTHMIAARLKLSPQYVNRQRETIARRIVEGVNSMDEPDPE